MAKRLSSYRSGGGKQAGVDRLVRVLTTTMKKKVTGTQVINSDHIRSNSNYATLLDALNSPLSSVHRVTFDEYIEGIDGFTEDVSL